MNKFINKEIDILMVNYPELSGCKENIFSAYELMRDCYSQNGLIMTCGNGGSAADASHIVGELMKGFKLKRSLTAEERKILLNIYPDKGDYLAENLQRAIPAISLPEQVSFATAFINDMDHEMIYAQQVFGYGRKGDVLIGLSTSGNSPNVVNACKIAKAFGINTIGLTGESGGEISGICDIAICVPAQETFRVQEYHLPVYHALCAMMEVTFFKSV